MFKLIGAVLVVLALGGVADVAARSAAEAQLAATVRARAPGAVGVSASIESFPFVPGLLASGRGGDVTVTIDSLAAGRVRLHDVTIAADGVVVDRDRLIPDFDVRVTGVDQARITTHLRDAELSQLLGFDVDVSPGAIAVERSGVRIESDARVDGDAIVLGLGRLPDARVALPRSAVLPCAPSLRLVERALELSCTADEVPPALLELAGKP